VSSPSPSEARLRINTAARLPATWTLATLLVVVHVVTAFLWSRHGTTPLTDALFFDRTTPFRIFVGGQHTHLLGRGQWWRLATSTLLHVNGLHLTLNVASLLALGRLLEPPLGAARLLAWFALGGVVASIGSAAFGVLQSDGASGGLFCLLAAGAWLGVRHRSAWPKDDRRLMGPILTMFLAINLAIGFWVPAIDTVAHTTGLVTGLLLAMADPVRPGRLLPTLYVAGTALFVAVCLAGWLS